MVQFILSCVFRTDDETKDLQVQMNLQTGNICSM